MEFSLNERYRHKIKTAKDLAEILGKPPRKDKVVMCHGVFDVVHPGHIRHLLYAKNKAPVLIASLTGDNHIDKGIYRPHIPQELRAFNLSAYEFVDYVIIDPNATPLEHLEIIKPDIFAKGYEYSSSSDQGSRTRDEIKIVGSYGGEVIFTPGDVVFSSSAIINASPPQIPIEKFTSLISRFGITFRDLRSALEGLKGTSIHVVGDTIIDTYTECTMFGGQTKTPTLSVHFESESNFLGGAGIVAEHLRATGANVKLTSVVGEDILGEFTSKRLRHSGIEANLIVDKNRPTVKKNAIVVGGYRLLKIDTVDNRSISDDILSRIIYEVQNSKECEAIIFSDFRHGIFNKRTIPSLINAIPKEAFKVADSQVASRWGNILEFKNFDLITPNEREARFSLGDQDSGIRPLASRLFDECQTKLLILKLSDRGILTCLNKNHESSDSFFVMDSFVNRLIDPVGAGDALLAYATLSMVTTKNPVISSIIGNLAAACACEHDGNQAVAPIKIQNKLDFIQKIIES